MDKIEAVLRKSKSESFSKGEEIRSAEAQKWKTMYVVRTKP